MKKRLEKANRTMQDEYDFSPAQRGKFYRKGAGVVPPVHLEPDVLKYFQARAEARGTSLSQLVNQLLKKDIELIEAASTARWKSCPFATGLLELPAEADSRHLGYWKKRLLLGHDQPCSNTPRTEARRHSQRCIDALGINLARFQRSPISASRSAKDARVPLGGMASSFNTTQATVTINSGPYLARK